MSKEESMQDYQPLDLAPFANVGVDFFSERGPLPLGRQSFHGLPFSIGGDTPDQQRCLIGLGGAEGSSDPLTVAIASAARYLIFAHVLLESYVLNGEPVGRVVATYHVRYSDGSQLRVPIRERFEIAAVP